MEGASFGITEMNDKDIRDDETVFLECILGRIVWYWRPMGDGCGWNVAY